MSLQGEEFNVEDQLIKYGQICFRILNTYLELFSSSHEIDNF